MTSPVRHRKGEFTDLRRVFFDFLDVVPAGGRLVLAVLLHAELAAEAGLVVWDSLGGQLFVSVSGTHMYTQHNRAQYSMVQHIMYNMVPINGMAMDSMDSKQGNKVVHIKILLL